MREEEERSKENERGSQPRDAWGSVCSPIHRSLSSLFSWSVIRVVTSSRYGTTRPNLLTPTRPQLWHPVPVILHCLNSARAPSPSQRSDPRTGAPILNPLIPPLWADSLLHLAQFGGPAPAPSCCFPRRVHSSTNKSADN